MFGNRLYPHLENLVTLAVADSAKCSLFRGTSYLCGDFLFAICCPHQAFVFSCLQVDVISAHVANDAKINCPDHCLPYLLSENYVAACLLRCAINVREQAA